MLEKRQRQTTMFTKRPGTTMIFFAGLPSINFTAHTAANGTGYAFVHYERLR